MARSRTLVMTALLGAVATACSEPVRRSPVARSVPVIEVAPAAHSIEEPAAPEPAPAPAAPGARILIERAHDPNRLAGERCAHIDSTIEKALARAGLSATADKAAAAAEFLVSPTVQSVTTTSDARTTTITCSITLRVAPWSAEERVERWEPHTTAAASGEARATTSNSPAQIELGIRDCLEGATKAAASRQVIPFLLRVSRRE